MADAHPGFPGSSDTRIRILCALFEGDLNGRPPSRAELRRRTGFSSGTIDYHLPRLADAGLVIHELGARGTRITATGKRALEHEGYVYVERYEPVYAFTARGIELLERAPRRI